MKKIEDMLSDLNKEQTRAMTFAVKDIENLRFEIKLFEMRQKREIQSFCENMRLKMEVLCSNLQEGYPDTYFPEGEEPLPSIVIGATSTKDLIKIEQAIQEIREEGANNVDRASKGNRGIVAGLSNVVRNRFKA